MKYLLMFTIGIILCSCSDPGYSVRINIGEDAKATEEDLNSLTEYIHKKNHEVIVEEGNEQWNVKGYKIKLDDKRFDTFEHKYINFVIEYYFSEPLIEEKKLLKSVEVRIGNSWEGRKPILRKEIDTISNIVVNRLKQRFKKSDFTITRKFVTPM